MFFVFNKNVTDPSVYELALSIFQIYFLIKIFMYLLNCVLRIDIQVFISLFVLSIWIIFAANYMVKIEHKVQRFVGWVKGLDMGQDVRGGQTLDLVVWNEINEEIFLHNL